MALLVHSGLVFLKNIKKLTVFFDVFLFLQTKLVIATFFKKIEGQWLRLWKCQYYDFSHTLYWWCHNLWVKFL